MECLNCNGTGVVGMAVDPIMTHPVPQVESSTFYPAVMGTSASERPEDGNGWWYENAYAELG